MGQLRTVLGRAREWWRTDDSNDALGGPALDPAYNGWYVTAVPRHDTARDVDDTDDPAPTVDEH